MKPFQPSPAASSFNGSNDQDGQINPQIQAETSLVPIPATGPFLPPGTGSILESWQRYAQQEEDNDLRNLLMVVRRRAWVIAGVAALVMSGVAVKTLGEVEIFKGQFRMLVEPVNADQDLSELTSVLGDQRLAKSGLDYETQVQVLRSPELINPVADQLQLMYPDISYLTLLENLSITRLGETKILEVSYTSASAIEAQVVLDKLSQTYLEYSLDERQTNLRQGINFIEKQLPTLQSQVDSIQAKLESFRRQYNFITPELQSGQLSETQSSLMTQRLELEREFSEAKQTYSNLQDSSGALAALEGAPVYQQLLGELRSVETKLAEELTRFNPDSLSIRVLEEQRANMLPLLQQEAQRVVGTKGAIATNNLQILQGQGETLAGAEQQVSQGLSQLPSLIRVYTDLQRELEVSTQALTRFRATQETLTIEAAQTEIPWQLIEAPMQPTKPISPDLQRSLLVGAVASLLLGLGAALLMEKLDNVYHSVDELKAGTKLPLLGTLPFNRELSQRDGRSRGFAAIADRAANFRFGNQAKSGHYGYGGDSESSFLEALRVLHTNIRMLGSDKPITSILVSSALPGDGKSTVAANFAQVATAMGQRVLIVDVDLRKPQVHDRLDVSNQLGLSNLIADDVPLKSVIQQVEPSGNLFVLTAGKLPPDPAKLLASHKMHQLMGTFERCFDLVIYDAPPTTGLADVSLIGQQTDGLVLVTRMGKTDCTVLSQTIETLKMAKIPVLGMVANGVKSHGFGGYRYYAYGYGSAGSSEQRHQADGGTGDFAIDFEAAQSSANSTHSNDHELF